MPIKKLPPETANQIAAGEVVENPASVVKELVENALDAGAGRIRVLLQQGGLREITVIDNGSGIPPGELRLAVERHATSKILDIGDLGSVLTLGFRGEALPSIASVSRLTITSRHYEDEAGASIFLEGGVEKDFKEIGFPVGTRVTVQDLFFNTPARRKFLKGISAETAKVSRMMQVLSLSRPDVSFTLEREKGVLWETSGDGNLKNVILTLFGHDLGKQLIPLDFTEKEYRLRGYVSDPTSFRNNRGFQFFYVNGRAVQSKPLRESLDKSYSSLITSKKYPLAFLFLSLPPADIDVNVHPSKTEIRLYQEELVRSFLVKSLSAAFQGGRRFPVYNWRGETIQTEKKTDSCPQKVQIQENILAYGENELEEKPGYFNREHLLKSEKPALNKEPLLEKPFYDMIVGQAFGTYILLQKGEDLLFMDQHAAHERILWERVQQTNSDLLQGSQIALPLPFELPLYIAEEIYGKLNLLEEIGLELERFGHNTFIIRTVPLFLKDVFYPEMLLDLFEKLTSQPLKREDFQKEALLQLSCKAALKANKALTTEEIRALLEQLEKCRDPFFCPHGRPVFFKMNKAELEKYFKRR
ncbi:MAG: DNA mismatch repair endonuclease MutL [Firmicutes bacterium]|nr:DNA mismatch repair endonuclease MutL [Bacillota bacterium]